MILSPWVSVPLASIGVLVAILGLCLVIDVIEHTYPRPWLVLGFALIIVGALMLATGVVGLGSRDRARESECHRLGGTLLRDTCIKGEEIKLHG